MTRDALALPAAGDLMRQMQATRTAISMAPLAEAMEAREKAQLVRQWAKVKKLAADVALEATRLELTAFRRMMALGWQPPKDERAAGKWLAERSDWEFDDLLRKLHAPTSAAALYANQRRRVTLERLATGGKRLRAAASRVVRGADKPRTMAAMVADLAADLEIQSDLLAAGPVPAGLRAAITDALGDYTDYWYGRCPGMITVRTHDGEWLHVPWKIATVGQYRQLVAYRREQAAALEKALDELVALELALAQAAPDVTDQTAVQPLLCALFTEEWGHPACDTKEPCSLHAGQEAT